MTTCITATDGSGADLGIRELRLARPPVNALDAALCRALADALQRAADEDVRGIVLAGGASVFSAGLDVPYLLSLGDDRAALSAAWQAFFDAVRALAASPVPVVAAIDGHAPAGGCVLALCCDYRVMVDGDGRIGLNETQVGLVAPEGVQRLLRRAVGPHVAARLLMQGELVDAPTALRIGLVDALAPDSADPIAREWLRELLKRPRQPMLTTRGIARAELVESLRPLHIDMDRFIEAWFAPQTQAALQALVARLKR